MFFSAFLLFTSFLRVAGYALSVGSAFQLGFLPPKTYFFHDILTLNSWNAEMQLNLAGALVHTIESKTGLSSGQHRSVINEQ